GQRELPDPGKGRTGRHAHRAGRGWQGVTQSGRDQEALLRDHLPRLGTSPRSGGARKGDPEGRVDMLYRQGGQNGRITCYAQVEKLTRRQQGTRRKPITRSAARRFRPWTGLCGSSGWPLWSSMLSRSAISCSVNGSATVARN